MKKIIISIIIVTVFTILLALVFDWGRRDSELLDINTDVTTTSTGQSANMPIVVDYPKDDQEISSPVKIKGKARGSWFFEASFPIELIDTEGNILAFAIATAESDWMTTEFVNFSANLEYKKTSTSTGHAILILSKDNPSDNPDFDQSIFIPVILK